MPGIDGLEATRRITADPQLTQTKIIVLTTFELDEYVYDALMNGASGFLLKDTAPAELLRAIRLVADGGALLAHRHPHADQHVRRADRPPDHAPSAAAHAHRTRARGRRHGR